MLCLSPLEPDEGEEPIEWGASRSAPLSARQEEKLSDASGSGM